MHLRKVRLTNCLFDQLRHLAVNPQRQILLGDLAAQFRFDLVENSNGIGIEITRGRDAGGDRAHRARLSVPAQPRFGSLRSRIAGGPQRNQRRVVFLPAPRPPLFLVACPLSFSASSPLSLLHSRFTVLSDLFQFCFEA